MASFFTPPFLLSCITLSLLLQIPSYSSTTDDYYKACRNLYDCGNIKNLGFPFWGNARPKGCGYPELYLNCSEDSTFITIRNVTYQVLDANPDQHVLKMVRLDYMNDLCPNQLLNTSLDPLVLQYVPEIKNLTLLYGCPIIPSLNSRDFSCRKNGFHTPYGYALLFTTPDIFVSCYTSVVVPVEVPTSLVDLVDLSTILGLLKDGFEVKWIAGIVECYDCQKTGGVCVYDVGSYKPACYRIRGDATPQPQPQPQGPSGTSLT